MGDEEVYRLAYQLYWRSFLEEYGKTDHKSLRTAKELRQLNKKGHVKLM